MDYSGMSDKGPVRQENQDAFEFLVEDGILLGAVCDGMGGENGGSIASHIAIECFISSFRQQFSEATSESENASISLRLPIMLKKAALYASDEVYLQSSKDEKLKGMGTTIVAAALHLDTLYCLNVGDSRLYRYSEGLFDKITKDHSYNQFLMDSGYIDRGDSYGHNLLTMALGCGKKVKPDVFIFPYDEDDIYLLCSDGIYNSLGDKLPLIVEHNKEKSAKEISKALIDEAIRNKADDNITALIIKV